MIQGGLNHNHFDMVRMGASDEELGAVEAGR